MHTIEKSAEILIKVLSMKPDKLQTITPDNFRDLADAFHLELPERFLYEKINDALHSERELQLNPAESQPNLSVGLAWPDSS